MSDPSHYTAKMAADPELSPAAMQQIAASRPDLLAALASNPSLYPALLEWLASYPDPSVQAVVAVREAQVNGSDNEYSEVETKGGRLAGTDPTSEESGLLGVSVGLGVDSGLNKSQKVVDQLLEETVELTEPYSEIDQETARSNDLIAVIRNSSLEESTTPKELLGMASPQLSLQTARALVSDLEDSSPSTLVPVESEILFSPVNEPFQEQLDQDDLPAPGSPLDGLNKGENRRRFLAIPAVLVVLILAGFGVHWLAQPQRPAPEGALDISEFASPHENLQCQFMQNGAGQNYVKCTVHHYEFVPDVNCDDSSNPNDSVPMTFDLFEDGTVKKKCTSVGIVKDKPPLEYGMSTAQNGFACTIKEKLGFTCWVEDSGKGFTIGTHRNEVF